MLYEHERRIPVPEQATDPDGYCAGHSELLSEHHYRNMHPLYPVQSKKNSPPPMKGTKRYRKEQKRAAKKARRQSIAHVLTLIENLDTQARVARSM